jgi:hypothetical protein
MHPAATNDNIGSSDDSVKHFEAWDGLYFANEYSDAVSPRTLL